MATCRFAHYLKVMARDKIGSFMEAEDCENWLNRWIMNYVNANDNAGQEIKARYPLREAKVEVREIPGKPGSYNAVAYLRPWLQMEELTTSLRMVAQDSAAATSERANAGVWRARTIGTRRFTDRGGSFATDDAA